MKMIENMPVLSAVLSAILVLNLSDLMAIPKYLRLYRDCKRIGYRVPVYGEIRSGGIVFNTLRNGLVKYNQKSKVIHCKDVNLNGVFWILCPIAMYWRLRISREIDRHILIF